MSKSKPHIVVFVDWFLPGYQAGGPIRSVANMVKILQAHYRFSIVTSHKDFGASSGYEGITPNVWIQREDCQVNYRTDDAISKEDVRGLLKELQPDIVYFNSFFSSKYTLTPLKVLKSLKVDAKVVLAPRGMLAKEALQIKATKKRIFMAVAKTLGWYKGITWHASTALEADEIQAVFGNSSKIRVAQNLTVLPEVDIHANRPQKEPGSACFFFISRIAIKKNLHLAIEALADVTVKGHVTFEIYGPIDEAPYWEQCQAAMQKVPNVDFQYKGTIAHEDVGAMEAQQHFFVLPTLNENFGHVVVEALSNGAPVVISDQTPWLKLAAKQVGWDLPLSKVAWTKQLQHCVDLDQQQFEQWSENAAKYGRAVVNDQETITRNVELFRNL